MIWLKTLLRQRQFSQRSVSVPEDLEIIHKKDVNFAYCKRYVDDDVELFARYLILHGFKGINQIVAAGNVQHVVNSMLTSGDFPSFGRTKLVQDIVRLSNIFFKVTGADHVRLILKVVEDDACRKFHTDAYDLRMLCTYVGKGTEWVPDKYVNRKKLIAGTNEDIIRDFTKVRTTDPFEVTILKGEIQSQPDRRGIVHRSPPIQREGGKRLLFRLDF